MLKLNRRLLESTLKKAQNVNKKSMQIGERQARVLEAERRQKRLEYLDINSQIHSSIQQKLKPESLKIQAQAKLVKTIKDAQFKSTSQSDSLNLSSEIKKLKNLKKSFSKFESSLLSDFNDPNFNSKRFSQILEKQFFFSDSFNNYQFTKGLVDYGPAGLKLRKNIEQKIREIFINKSKVSTFEVETPILTPELVFEKSGHVGRFNDLVVKDLNDGEILRVDHLFDKKREKLEQIKTTTCILELGSEDKVSKLLKLIYPKRSFSEPFKLGLMFKTNGSVDNASEKIYFLRPETAQGAYLAFKKVLAFNQNKLPFAICQFGKAFRNESSASSANLKRLKEFNMAEIQVFYDSENFEKINFINFESDKTVTPTKLLIWTKQDQQSGQTATVKSLDGEIIKNGVILSYLKKIAIFSKRIGLDPTKIRLRQHNSDELAHYSSDCWDLEVDLGDGSDWLECIGVSDRGCYDLSAHDISLSRETRANNVYTPSIIEPSFGLDRLTFAVLAHNLKTRLANKDRSFFTFPVELAPFKVGITMAHNSEQYKKLVSNLHSKFKSLNIDSHIIQNNSQIGAQYVKLDELGIPFIITFDKGSLIDTSLESSAPSVTIRDRDTLDQKRVLIENLDKVVLKLVGGKLKFDDINL